MQNPRFSYRILLAIWACGLALALGIEVPRASALDEGCWSICNDECEGHGGCAFFQPVGCDCFFECEDGHDDYRICVE